MHLLQWLPNWLPSSVMRSNDDSDWPVHSLMLLLHDLRGLPLRRLPSTVLCIRFLAAYHDGGHGRTMITCTIWRLTMQVPDVWRGQWPPAIILVRFVLPVWTEGALVCLFCTIYPHYTSWPCHCHPVSRQKRISAGDSRHFGAQNLCCCCCLTAL